jgi:hypothetical protein
MSKVQGPDEGDQRTHLPPATEVEMSEVRQGQDAEAKGEVRFVIHTIASWRRAVSQGAQRQPVTSRAPLNSHLRRRVFGWLPITRNNALVPRPGSQLTFCVSGIWELADLGYTLRRQGGLIGCRGPQRPTRAPGVHNC